jgi:Flp pilus assembly protein TadB
MFKFLPGILLLQLVTAGLVLICVSWSQEPQLIIVVAAFGFILAVLTTFWFGSIVRNMQNSTQAKLQAKHAQDRERIIRRAEREKAKVTSESYQQIEKAAQKAHAKANFKVGASFAAAIGIGGIMVFSQLVTVGMMVLVASGSGLAGYLVRAKQDRQSRKNKLSIPKVTQAITKQIDEKKPVSEKNKLKTLE